MCARAPGCPRHWAERNAELVRQRDEARAEAERLRLGRVELQGMHRAAVELARRLTAAGEALSRVLGRTVPTDAAALVAERREALDAWGRARDGRP